MNSKSLTIMILAGVMAATAWAQTPVGTNEPTYKNTTEIPLAITTPDPAANGTWRPRESSCGRKPPCEGEDSILKEDAQCTD